MSLSVFASLLPGLAAALLAAPQTPIPPVRIEPAGGGTPIVVQVTGVEQDPATIAPAWNGDDKCLADVACFVASWIEANQSSSVDHLTALRPLEERAQFQQRIRDPQVLQRNATRFREVRKWALLGWVEYGAYRIVLLTRDEGRPTPGIYTLPLKRGGAALAQSDALAGDTGIFEICDRVGREILKRHQKP